MLTSQVVRPSYRPYLTRVARVARLSDSFLRVTFTGDDLDVFGDTGLDQRIKLLIPFLDGSVSDVGADDEESRIAGDWYARWRDLPNELRNPMRTYTVRAIRQDDREIDVDFVCHGDTGPASAWVLRAMPGDEIVIIGPDVRSPNHREGVEFAPGAATRLLFVGDETAVPAITSILETLPAHVSASAILEVPHAGDALPVAAHDGVEVTWLAREGAETGSLLHPAVQAWCARRGFGGDDPDELSDIDVDFEVLWETPDSAPTDGFYAWVAGESSMVKTVRRHLVRECGVHRSQVAFMGYWRAGRSEGV